MSIKSSNAIISINIETPNTIAAATFQLCLDERKCSKFLYAPLFQAIRDPFTPRQILIPRFIKLKIGEIIARPIIVKAKESTPTTSCTRDTYTLLKTPQIHPKKNAPQFH